MSLTPKSRAWVAVLASLTFAAPAWAQLNSTSPNTLNNTTTSVLGAGNTSCGTSVAGCSGLAPPNVNVPTEGTGSTAAAVGTQPPAALTPNGGAVGGLPPPSVNTTVPGTVAGQATSGIAPAPGINTAPGANAVGIGNNGLATNGAGAPSYGGLGAYAPAAPAPGAALPGSITPPGIVNTPLASNGAATPAGGPVIARSAGR
jgi:hypothetical protein